MTAREDVVQLAQEYLAQFSHDHHKDRDCHFEVTMRISAYPDRDGNYVRGWCASHEGYINRWSHDGFGAAEDAWQFHAANLRLAIAELKRIYAEGGEGW